MTYLDFLKKSKLLKFQEPSTGIIGVIFLSCCLIFFFLMLDCRILNGLRGQFQLSSKLNHSSVVAKKLGFLEVGDGACDLYVGNWVWDETYPLYRSQDCLFLDTGFRCTENGRPDDFYTKWRWQPKDCDLPRFDAKDLLENCVANELPLSVIRLEETSGSLFCGRAPKSAPKNVKMTLRLDQIDWSSAKWRDADLLVINTGHWWNYEKTIRGGCYFQEGGDIKLEMSVPTALRRSIRTLSNWITREVNFSRTHVIFRGYAPVHFRGGNWKSGGGCHTETIPDIGEEPEPSERHLQYRAVVEGLAKHIENGNIDFLNVTGMTSRRKDAHSSMYYLNPKTGKPPIHRQDCSHWCLPGVPDIWNELLYAVVTKGGFLRGDHEKNASVSLFNPLNHVL